MELPDDVFTGAQALAAGLSRSRLRSLLQRGEVRRVLRGVYAAASTSDDVGTRIRAAALVVPEHCVVVDRTAAWLHGVDSWPAGWLDVPPPLDIVSANREPCRRPELVAGRRQLTPDEITVSGGVLVTTPLRTACDCARLRGRWAALACLDGFMRVHGLTHEELREALPRFRGRRGCIQLRELVPLATPLAESAAESWARLAMHDGGLPAPRLQWVVTLPAFGTVRLDLAYPRLRIAIEYDGHAFHSSTLQIARDAARRDALRSAGWLVIVLTKDDLSPESLQRTLGRIGRAVEDRRPSSRRIYSRMAG